MNKLPIKKGDTVIVIAGKDKGKEGAVERVFPKRDVVIVAGVNVKKKHQKPRSDGKKGSIIDKTLPVHISNVMLLDPKAKKPTRTTRGVNKAGKTVRITKKSRTEV